MNKSTLVQDFKFRLFVTACLYGLFFLNVNAQCPDFVRQSSVKVDTVKKSIGLIIKIDPFWTDFTTALGPQASKIYSAAIEKLVGHHFSFQFTTMLNHAAYPDEGYYNSSESDNIWLYAPQVKYYFDRSNRHRGLFLGAFAEFMHEIDAFNNSVQHVTYYTNSYGGGIMTGAQFYGSDKVVIEVLFGIGQLKQYGNDGYISNGGTFLSGLMDINFGYKF